MLGTGTAMEDHDLWAVSELFDEERYPGGRRRIRPFIKTLGRARPRGPRARLRRPIVGALASVDARTPRV